MSEFVPVPVPAALVSRVMRLVADFLEEASEPAEVSEFGLTWAGVLTSGDSQRLAPSWWRWLRPSERQLLRVLREAPGHALEALDVARQLNASGPELAGILGPLHRRSRRDGYPTAVRSRQQNAADGSGRRIKVLSLEPAVASLIDDYDTGEPPEPPPPPRVRRRSAAAEALHARRRPPTEGR